MTDPHLVTVDYLRQFYANWGLAPSEQELASLVPMVQALFDATREVEQLLMLEQEPAITLQLPHPDK